MLRAGLIGLGAMGRHHARALAQLDGVSLVAAADPQGDVHQALHHVPVVATVDELLQARPDYCVVATPPESHAPIALVLAAHGVHALIEKPAATNTHDATRVAAAFEDAHLVAAVGHIERFNPAIQALRAQLQAGEIGELHYIATRRYTPTPARTTDVGAIFDLAVHDIDTATWVTGSAITDVTAHTIHARRHPHEDALIAIGHLGTGDVVNHLTTWLSPFKERVTVALGTRGCLVADTVRTTLTLYRHGPRTANGITEPGPTDIPLRAHDPLAAQHQAFRDALAGRATNLVTMRDAVGTVATAEAMIQSAATGGPVRVVHSRRPLLTAPTTSIVRQQAMPATPDGYR